MLRAPECPRRLSLLLAAALAAVSASGQERRPLEPPKGEPGPAPTLPEQFRQWPRVPVSDEARLLAPLTVRLSNGRTTACYQALWRGDRPEAVTLPIPGSPRKVTLLQLGYDPARRTRYLFFDAGDSARGAFLSASPFEPQGTVSIGSATMAISAEAEPPDCEKVTASPPIGRNKRWRDGDGPNAGAALARVEILEETTRPVWGWCLAEGYGGASTHAGIRNPAAGARQEWKLYSYVPAEGGSIALVLEMTADWTDPRDGRVYRYFQLASGEFFKLAKEGSTAFRLDAGPAVPRPVEVKVFAEEDWPGCASRAALRD